MINWYTPWAQMWIEMQGRLAFPTTTSAFLPQARLHPATAQEAWAAVQEHLHAFDGQCALTSVEACDGVLLGGVAVAWVFGVDCLQRKAKGEVRWQLEWDGSLRQWVRAQVQAQFSPYPAVGSPVYCAAARGEHGAKLLDAAWRQMRETSIDIPMHFEDTDAVWRALERHLTYDCHVSTQQLLHNTAVRLATVSDARGVWWETTVARDRWRLPVVAHHHGWTMLSDDALSDDMDNVLVH